METRGKKLLKFCGVLFIIEGIIGVLTYGILALFFEAATITTHTSGGQLVVGVTILYLIAAIISIIAGVLGVKNAPSKQCIVWGMINLVLTFVASMGTSTGDSTMFNAVFNGFALIIPSLYIAGAYMNEN